MFGIVTNVFTFIVFMYRLPPPSALEMLIPANAAGKVIGKGGANIANIRKVGLLSTFHCYWYFLILL